MKLRFGNLGNHVVTVCTDDLSFSVYLVSGGYTGVSGKYALIAKEN